MSTATATPPRDKNAFSVSHECGLSPAAAWARVTDWPAHARHVPLTTVEVTTAGPTGVGTTFVARTALGRIGFGDWMTVVIWRPPADPDGTGLCRLEKSGRVMLGHAELTVEPSGTGSRTTWTEHLRVAGVPSVFAPVTALSGRLLFGRVLRALLEDRPPA